jgi:NADPH2 dehydrogenase
MVYLLFLRVLLAAKLALTRLMVEMRMKDPLPTFSHLISEIKRRWPDLAYIHVIEPRQNEVYAGIISGPVDLSGTNDHFRDIWAPRPFISCGAYAYDRESGIKTAEEKGDIIAYGRPFIANVS